MEGELLKWTNYFSGWQPRWFILDNGVLSYYKSQEDIVNGCKGSIKMAVCDIAVHPTDMTRLDLTIPGEQYYYVKAGTPQDRQSWLIALGSSKAAFSETSMANKNADVVPDLVRTKQSELRLYCDLLMQQVHSVKQLASKSDGFVEPEKLTESASLIAATCDMFIVTLDDCMKLISHVPVLESTHHHLVRSTSVSVSPSLPSLQRLQGSRPVVAEPGEKPGRHKSLTVSFTDSIRVHSLSSHHTLNGGSSPKQLDSPTIHHPVISHSFAQREPIQIYTTPPLSAQPTPSPSISPSSPGDGTFHPLANVGKGNRPQISGSNGSLLNGTKEQISPGVISSSIYSDSDISLNLSEDAVSEDTATFFSTMATSFADVDTSQDDCILVIPFLEACKNLVPIFDKLSSTALSPVKMDFCGNIRKIEHKHGINPEEFISLQSMVLYEIKNKQNTHSDSATSALLWLKRSLEFIAEFLKECCSGCMDITVCAGNAYSRTLKHYHGWVVRGIFAVAVRALPYRETFISHLSVEDNTDTTSQHFEQVLLSHIKTFELHLSRVLAAINEFYFRHSLDSSDTV